MAIKTRKGWKVVKPKSPRRAAAKKGGAKSPHSKAAAPQKKRASK